MYTRSNKNQAAGSPESRKPAVTSRTAAILIRVFNSYERSKAWVCSRSPAGIASSNPAGGMDVCLLWVLCVVR
jgi:hypothetical protein